MSYDPLANTPSTPIRSPAVPPSSPFLPNLSPLAPRSPLPGQLNGHYRPQPLPPPPSTSHWTSPPSNSHWTSPPASATSGSQRGMTPRSPQGYEEQGRRGDWEERGGEGRPSPPDGFVRIKIMALEKNNRRDYYVKFNAESNLPTFRQSAYRGVSRSYTEFQRLAEALAANNPQSIVPALPLAQTSAATEEEDVRLVKSAFQRWVARVTSDAALMKEDELRSFIESEFGYTPSTSSRRKTPSTFHFPRTSRLPDEQDDDLTLAKSSMSHLELTFSEAAKVVERLSRARRAAAVAQAEVGDQLATFAMTETYAPLAAGVRKVARSVKVGAELMGAQASSEMVALGDSLAYQASNARSAKDTLSSRDVILDEHRAAVKSTLSRKRTIERLKASSNLRSERVDEALDDLDDAQKHETLLSARVSAISRNLQPSLRMHSRNAHEDLLAALVAQARSALLYERQGLKELEGLRTEVRGIQSAEVGVWYHTAAGRGVGGEGRSEERGRREAEGRRDESIVASPTTERRSIQSMARSVVVQGDARQRVDAKMAASMLAGF